MYFYKDYDSKEKEKIYIGKIIVNEKYIFEGIIQNIEQDQEYYIIGKTDQENNIQKMHMYSPEELPKVYIKSRETNDNQGFLQSKTSTGKVIIGECKIRIIDPYTYREVNELGEKISIKSQIYTIISEMQEQNNKTYKKIMMKNTQIN